MEKNVKDVTYNLGPKHVSLISVIIKNLTQLNSNIYRIVANLTFSFTKLFIYWLENLMQVMIFGLTNHSSEYGDTIIMITINMETWGKKHN